ncbi:MAG: polysaccharide deacetylase family protein [Clostridia bacterium]|nr:polysaccharide deacetylase family protein [Clostridia bacterium]
MFATIRLKTIKIVISFCLIACLLTINFKNGRFAGVYFGSALREIPIYNVETQEKKIAISFDAAWGADKTEKIMSILKEYNCDATFFLVGFWVEEYPEIAKKIAENGFEIGTHSNTHPDMVKLDKLQKEKELKQSVEIIKNITGYTPRLFRAPFGSYNDELILTAKSLNLTTIQWNIDSLDWKGIGASEIYNRIVSKAKNGSIILCHNNADFICEALPSILIKLKNDGFEFVKISELIYSENYEIKHDGTQVLL